MPGCQECAFCNPYENSSKTKKQTQNKKTTCGRTIIPSIYLLSWLSCSMWTLGQANTHAWEAKNILVLTFPWQKHGKSSLGRGRIGLHSSVLRKSLCLFQHIEISDQKFVLIGDSSSKIPWLPWDTLPTTLSPKEGTLLCLCMLILTLILLCLPNETGQRNDVCSKLNQPDLFTDLFMQT